MVIRIQLLYYNNHSKLLEFESSNQLAGIYCSGSGVILFPLLLGVLDRENEHRIF